LVKGSSGEESIPKWEDLERRRKAIALLLPKPSHLGTPSLSGLLLCNSLTALILPSCYLWKPVCDKKNLEGFVIPTIRLSVTILKSLRHQGIMNCKLNYSCATALPIKPMHRQRRYLLTNAKCSSNLKLWTCTRNHTLNNKHRQGHNH
jgi:hypothetical protein